MWKWLSRRAQDERDLDDEIRFHLAEETRLRTEAGDRQARASARRAFGNVMLVKEVTRDMWGWRALETFLQDLRLGFRLLTRYRLFAGFSILSLALGIGGTSAIFTLYDAIVLRDLPVREPRQLVTFSIHDGGGGRANSFMPYPQFIEMHRSNQSVEGMFARTSGPMVSIGVGGAAEIGSALSVTGEYYTTLGVSPAVGRLLTPADDETGGAAVAVISHAYWQHRFGGSASILGETLALNQKPFTIVGVEPAGFFGVAIGSAPDVTIPMQQLALVSGRLPPFQAAFGSWIEIFGRLRPGVGIEQATMELDGLFRRVSLAAAANLAPDSPDARFARETHVRLASGARGGISGLRDGYEQGLRLLLVLLGGVLCLASLNVAALMLSRAEARRDEIATRLALGAGRTRIVAQLVTESFVIALGGGLLGLFIAWQGSAALLRFAMPDTVVFPVDLSPDARIVAFIGAISIGGCLVFGLLPAVRVTASARTSSRAEVTGRRRRVLDRTLVASQTAVALVLVVCAGLCLHSLRNLWTQETGYDRRNVLMFSIEAGFVGQRGPEALSTYQRVLEELRALPAARSVTLSTVRPVSDTYYFIDRVTKIGDQVLSSDAAIRVAFNVLSPGYFETIGIPLVAGRDFDGRDVGPDTPKVVIVTEQLARRFIGNPVGQQITFAGSAREIVGVARDTRYASVKDVPREVVYTPFFQQTSSGFPPTYEVKFTGSAAEALRSAREAVARVHPGLALFRAKTLEAQTEESFGRERMFAYLTTYFGVFSWLLAGVGLYGLLAYSVTQRTREFGLRMALGAHPVSIRWTVMRETAGTVVAGLAVGFGGALMAARLLDTQLYRVEPTDPTAIGGALIALLVLTCGAAYFHAHRASKIDPMTALRQE